MEVLYHPGPKEDFSGQTNIMKSLFTHWVLPFTISSLIFLVAKPILAQQISDVIIPNPSITGVGSEADESGFRQIYYIAGDKKTFITKTNYPNGEPNYNGDFITWMGQSTGGAWQIFLHNISTNHTTQISTMQNNANPSVSTEGNAVWEGWVNDDDGGRWQIFLFDGIRVVQLTQGDLSLNADIEGDYVSYGRKDPSGSWRGVVYSISKKESKDVSVGLATKKTQLDNGKIILTGDDRYKEFPLKADDLFLLDVNPLINSTPEPTDSPLVVTETEILNEIEDQNNFKIESTPLP